MTACTRTNVLRRRLCRAAGAAVAACAMALPAAAQAAPTWARVADPAPGGTLEYNDGLPILDLAVAEGTPYLATESTAGALTVWRPNAAGASWVQAGGALNHVPLRFTPPFRRKDFFSIAAGGATPWVAWTEQDAGGQAQVHVAKLAGARFQEPVAAAGAAGWPRSANAPVPQIVVYGGVPYVATDSDVTRLTGGGDAVEHVTTGLPSGCAPSLVVSGAYLYASCSAELLRLNSAGSAWEHVVTHSSPFAMADVGGTPYLVDGGVYRLNPNGQLEQASPDGRPDSPLGSFQGTLYAAHGGATPGPDVEGPATLEALVLGAWQAAPSPSQANEGVHNVKLVGAPDGNMWMVWEASDHNSVFPPRTVHVARFAEQGTPFSFAADPGSGSTPGGPGETPNPAPNPGDGGFTDPGGNPVPPGNAGGPLAGACANAMLGTLGSDWLVGTRLGDRLFGRAGNDHLFGVGGSDCIWASSGADFVSGGPGADDLNGGSGRDRIVAGAGRDSIDAGSGNDSIYAVGGGVDHVNCGRGFDTVRLSRNDLIKGCERVIVKR